MSNPIDQILEAAAVESAMMPENEYTSELWKRKYDGFKAGAHFERERIVKLIRENKGFIVVDDDECVIEMLCDWLESTLNERQE